MAERGRPRKYAYRQDVCDLKREVAEVKQDVEFIRYNDLRHLSRNVQYLMGAMAVILCALGGVFALIVLLVD